MNMPIVVLMYTLTFVYILALHKIQILFFKAKIIYTNSRGNARVVTWPEREQTVCRRKAEKLREKRCRVNDNRQGQVVEFPKKMPKIKNEIMTESEGEVKEMYKLSA